MVTATLGLFYEKLKEFASFGWAKREWGGREGEDGSVVPTAGNKRRRKNMGWREI